LRAKTDVLAKWQKRYIINIISMSMSIMDDTVDVGTTGSSYYRGVGELLVRQLFGLSTDIALLMSTLFSECDHDRSKYCSYNYPYIMTRPPRQHQPILQTWSQQQQPPLPIPVPVPVHLALQSVVVPIPVPTLKQTLLSSPTIGVSAEVGPIYRQFTVSPSDPSSSILHNLIPEHLQALALEPSLNGTPGHLPALILPPQLAAAVVAANNSVLHGTAVINPLAVTPTFPYDGLLPTLATTLPHRLSAIILSSPPPPLPALTAQNRPATIQPIYNGINPSYPGVQQLHGHPPVYRVDNFLTYVECDFLIQAAEGNWSPAPVVGRGAGEVSPSRTSSTCYLAREDLPDYMRKVSILTNKPILHCELPQVGRYLPSQQYLHVSAFLLLLLVRPKRRRW
jgi:hypothetical protein